MLAIVMLLPAKIVTKKYQATSEVRQETYPKRS
jgi:hypothetical protein